MSTALILLSDFRKTEIELWRPTLGYIGYEISNLGRVRSFWRKSGSGVSRNGKHGSWTYILSSSFTVLKGSPDKDGYRTVQLRTQRGKIKLLRIHRLVAVAFIPNSRPDIAIRVNHLTNMNTDNRAGNLEWCTEKENRDHAIMIGVWPHGEKAGGAKLTDAIVRIMRTRHENGEALTTIAADYKVSTSMASRIVRRKDWRHVA